MHHSGARAARVRTAVDTRMAAGIPADIAKQLFVSIKNDERAAVRALVAAFPEILRVSFTAAALAQK